MQVRTLPGGDADVEKSLLQAGVPNVEQLSRQHDLAALAHRSGITQERLVALQEAAREGVERALHEADVADETALAHADIITVAQKTGIALVELARFRELARAAVGLPPEPTRVLLRDGAPTAIVRFGPASVENVVILTAAPREDASQEALHRFPGDAVVLQAGAATATARLAGSTHAALPLFKLNDDGSELRVRVADIRERGPGSDPFWKRVFKKGGLGGPPPRVGP
ncbi:MAG: hypothetical protein WDA16_07575 [Candidatus Thermoplasmatota archaeon]